MKAAGRLLRSIFLVSLSFIAIMYFAQDALLFPGAVIALLNPPAEKEAVPEGVEPYFVTTSDGVRIEVWRVSPAGARGDGLSAALLFHGNGGGVRMFYPVQRWLASLGLASYSFSYRGYGRSSGWPSEEGIYRDSEAVWESIRKQQGIESEHAVFVGISIGSGFAAALASKHNPAVLLLLSPYASIPEVGRDQSFPLGYLTPLLRYSVPTEQYVSLLNGTCLLLVHGAHDTIIPARHSALLSPAYRGSGGMQHVVREDAGHNDLFFKSKGELEELIAGCSSPES